MGRLLSKLPTDVHLGKFLLIATLFRCLDPALTIAASLNSKSPFVTPFGLDTEADRAKASFKSGNHSLYLQPYPSDNLVPENSDFLTLHNAFSSWRRACVNTGHIHKFCRQNFLSHQVRSVLRVLRSVSHSPLARAELATD